VSAPGLGAPGPGGSATAAPSTPVGGRPAARRGVVARFAHALRRNRFAALALGYVVVASALIAFEPWLPLPSPYDLNLRNQFAPPGAEHWLGTDENGRDVLARLILGGRVSFAIAIVGALLTVLIASVVGVVAGYFGGVVDNAIMRLTDGLMSIPTFFLVMVIVALWGPSATVLIVALATTRWMGVARLVRAEVLRAKNMEYVTASVGLGASDFRIMLRHLLPQAVPSLVVATTINVGVVMLVEAGLSFLGVGILPPTPSWGNMLTASQYYMWIAPHLAIYPGMMIFLSVLSFNALGDVLRDVLDPRYRAGD
jgi:peptide/nickel transport system permease protein